MYDAIETIEQDGFTAQVMYDIDPASPAEWTNIGTLAYSTRNAGVGDLPSDHYGIGRFTDDCPRCEGTGELLIDAGADIEESTRPCPTCSGYGHVTDGAAIAARLHDAIVTLPVYAIDGQMGTQLSVADDWNEANGWIYATAESLKETGVTLEDAAKAMRQELETWEQWAQGDVYGVVVTGPDGRECDSVWGFYGLEEAFAEARMMLDNEIAHEREQAAKIDGMMRT